MDTINPITRLTGVTYGDLAAWVYELDAEINSLGFHSMPFTYRSNIQRFRVAIDQLAAAMRGLDDGETYPYYAAHKIQRLYQDPRDVFNKGYE